MPRIARQVGFLTGCAARYLTSARNRFAEFARDSELTQVQSNPMFGASPPSLPPSCAASGIWRGLVTAQLHQEMRSTLTTVQRIQEDLRRGVGLPNARCATFMVASSVHTRLACSAAMSLAAADF